MTQEIKRPRTLPHICFVAPQAWPVLSGSRGTCFVGGAEVQQCHIARGLAARGFRVSMLCLDYGQAPRVEVEGIHVYRLYKPNAGFPALRFLHPRLTSFWRGMRATDADIYYQRGSDMHTGVVAAFCRRYGKKSVFAGASNADFFPDQPWIRYGRDKWLFEYGLRRVDAVVAQNETQQQLCRSHYAREASLIRSCYPAPAMAQADPQGDVLWVSTIRKIKSPERFIEIARSLPGYRFTMIGGPGGTDAESLRYFESVRSAAAAVPNLKFLGFVHPLEVEQFFARARIFVNTSDTEGFPNTFLQAWARGVPTVSVFDTGSRHQGEPVCALAPDVRGFVDQIGELMRNPMLWEARGARCRAYFSEAHSMQSAMDGYSQLFSTLLHKT